MPNPICSVLAEIQWDFEGEDSNWRFLDNEATFAHKGACEFIVHIGSLAEDEGETPYWEGMVRRMRLFGCDDSFINAYIAAKDLGASHVLFWS